MYHQKKLIQMIQFEQKRCSEKINQLEALLANAPAGYLGYTNNNFYHVIKNNGSRTQKRLRKDDAFLDSLKEKRYLSKAFPILRNNLKFYNELLENINAYDIISLQAALPKHYHEFNCSKFMLKGDINPESWDKTPYKRNPAFPDKLVHRSANGLMTRSKAEAMIATRLEEKGLIFRYEPELWLGKHHYFPDFVIIHPTERRLIYWEHCGRMDEPEYANNAMEKFRVYSENGIHMGDNFIMTWETLSTPLTFQHIDDRIHLYLS